MKIFDAHNDFLTELNVRQRRAYVHWLKKYCKGTKIFAQVWTSELKQPMKKLMDFKKEIDKANMRNLVFAIEDLGCLNERNWKKNIKCIVKLRPFSCGIVWNNDNSLGGGAFGKSGLTRLGEKVVATLERAGIVVDTAHMNEQTFWNFCKITTKPIFNSHCNIYELNPHARNLKDEQIREIVKSGGIICLSFVKYFVSQNEKVKMHNIAEQIVWFVKKYGDRNVGIGSDFFGTKELPNDLKSYIDFEKLKEELYLLGLNNGQIKRIFYKNLNKFYKKFC